MKRPQRILIVDDHQLFMDGLAWILRQHGHAETVETTLDGASALARIDLGPPYDLILLDLKLPDMGGIALLRELRLRQNKTPVLMISATDLYKDARLALDHGALGFINKSATSTELLDAINTVLAGDIHLPSDWIGLHRNTNVVKIAPIRITPRQAEIVRLLALGLSNKAIADRLGIAENTLKAHLREIYRVIGVNNRTACVRQADQIGLL